MQRSEFRTMGVMIGMILLGVIIRFVQEVKSEAAAESLKKLVQNKVNVIRMYSSRVDRDPTPEDVEHMGSFVEIEIALLDIVPGDIIKLSAGDMIPADLKLIESKDLFVSQASLTGESMPAEKFVPLKNTIKKENNNNNNNNNNNSDSNDENKKDEKIDIYDSTESIINAPVTKTVKKKQRTCKPVKRKKCPRLPCIKKKKKNEDDDNVKGEHEVNKTEIVMAQHKSELEKPDLLLMGTSVVSGTGKAVVLKIGGETILGQMAKKLARARRKSAFQKGITRISYMFIGIITVMLPVVLIISGLVQKNWLEAFLFSISVAVGLTPEMLPMIVNTNLARGAIAMSKKKTIVKKMESIINFGAIDVLCTDKTGTLTQNKVVLLNHVDLEGKDSPKTLEAAFLNSHFQTSLKNLLDIAVIEFFNKQDPINNIQKILAQDDDGDIKGKENKEKEENNKEGEKENKEKRRK